MKKLLFVLALGAFAASCGNSSTEKTGADSTLSDSTLAADTTSATVDSSALKVDSTVAPKADSAK